MFLDKQWENNHYIRRNVRRQTSLFFRQKRLPPRGPSSDGCNSFSVFHFELLLVLSENDVANIKKGVLVVAVMVFFQVYFLFLCVFRYEVWILKERVELRTVISLLKSGEK